MGSRSAPSKGTHDRGPAPGRSATEAKEREGARRRSRCRWAAGGARRARRAAASRRCGDGRRRRRRGRRRRRRRGRRRKRRRAILRDAAGPQPAHRALLGVEQQEIRPLASVVIGGGGGARGGGARGGGEPPAAATECAVRGSSEAERAHRQRERVLIDLRRAAGVASARALSWGAKIARRGAGRGSGSGVLGNRGKGKAGRAPGVVDEASADRREASRQRKKASHLCLKPFGARADRCFGQL